MKKTFTLLALATVMSGYAQFSDDFENYTVDTYLGENSPIWRVWSNTGEGTDEDVKITDEDAANGTQSIRFTSTSANGGPQDVVLPFGAAFNSGLFDFQFNIKVLPGKSAYFNFQASEIIGDAWAMDCFFNADGSLELSNQGTTYLNSTFTHDVWFEMKMSINLNTNVWELFLDGVSQGEFFNPTNSVALLDLYPLNGSDFFIDDVYYEHVEVDLPDINGGVTNILGVTNSLATQEKFPEIEIRNLGLETVTSFDIILTYNGTNYSESFTGFSLNSLESTTITLTTPIELVAGTEVMTACMHNINGIGDDDDTSDDCKSITLTPAVPAPGKLVIGEEGTGTWCQWCPRGTVAMEYMAEEYPTLFQGIAVHNGDPMTVASYDSWMGSRINGYPSALLDRGTSFDPGQFEPTFLQRIVEPAAVDVVVTETAKISGQDKLRVTADITFNTPVTGSWRIACAIVEDGVTGTGNGYNQSNAYAGGGNGPMGGYESLPNPVPASQMVYDDVARGIQPDATGQAITATNVGVTYTYTFTFDLDPAWDLQQITAVPMVLDPSGRVDNAAAYLYDGTVGIKNQPTPSIETKLYPNPTSDWAVLNINIHTPESVTITITNSLGQNIATRNYGAQMGALDFPIHTHEFAPGIYFVEVSVGHAKTTQRLIVE